MRLPEGVWIRPSDGRILVEVKVIPGASRSCIAGLRDGCLLVRVAAAPEKGKANDELVDCLAKALGISRSSIEFVAGTTSRRKRLSLPQEQEMELRRLADPLA